MDRVGSGCLLRELTQEIEGPTKTRRKTDEMRKKAQFIKMKSARGWGDRRAEKTTAQKKDGVNMFGEGARRKSAKDGRKRKLLIPNTKADKRQPLVRQKTAVNSVEDRATKEKALLHKE